MSDAHVESQQNSDSHLLHRTILITATVKEYKVLCFQSYRVDWEDDTEGGEPRALGVEVAGNYTWETGVELLELGG